MLHIWSSVNLCPGTQCQVGTSATAEGKVKGVCVFVCVCVCVCVYFLCFCVYIL